MKNRILITIIFFTGLVQATENLRSGKNKHNRNPEKYAYLKVIQRKLQENCRTISLNNLEKLINECTTNYHTKVPYKSVRRCIPRDGGLQGRDHYSCKDLIKVLEGLISTIVHPNRNHWDKKKLDVEEIPENIIQDYAPYKLKQLEHKVAKFQKAADFFSGKIKKQ